MKNVEASRAVEEVAPSTEVQFRVDSSIREEERNPGVLRVNYSIDLLTQPAVARMYFSGVATIKEQDEEIERLVSSTRQPPGILKTRQDEIPLHLRS
jgi:hypothetical protein